LPPKSHFGIFASLTFHPSVCNVTLTTPLKGQLIFRYLILATVSLRTKFEVWLYPFQR